MADTSRLLLSSLQHLARCSSTLAWLFRRATCPTRPTQCHQRLRKTTTGAALLFCFLIWPTRDFVQASTPYWLQQSYSGSLSKCPVCATLSSIPPDSSRTDTNKPKALTPLNDSQFHLLAGSVYVTSQLECAISGGLAEASFWTFVVQDIQFALAYQIKMRLPLDALSRGLSQRWRDHSNLTEQDWVHRAIFLLAKTVDHCYSYGQNSPRTADNMTRNIKREIRGWEAKRPDTFQPLYFHPADSSAGRPFPTICYTHIEHGMYKLFEHAEHPQGLHARRPASLLI
jgi:hypothetical protein